MQHKQLSHFSDKRKGSQTKMRFELQRTWSTPMRLATWARNDKFFTQSHNNHDNKHRPTPNELIEEAQRTAIEETERFIREAAIRRGFLTASPRNHPNESF